MTFPTSLPAPPSVYLSTCLPLRCMRQPLHFTVSVPAMSTSASQPAMATRIDYYGWAYPRHRSAVYAEAIRLVELKAYVAHVRGQVVGQHDDIQAVVASPNPLDRDLRRTTEMLAEAIRLFRSCEALENAPHYSFGDRGGAIKEEVKFMELLIANDENEGA